MPLFGAFRDNGCHKRELDLVEKMLQTPSREWDDVKRSPVYTARVYSKELFIVSNSAEVEKLSSSNENRSQFTDLAFLNISQDG